MDENRAKRGFVWGVVATVVMSIPMAAGVATGLAPMPRPIPAAVVAMVLGDVPTPVRMLAALVAHLLYGGVFGALLVGMVRPVSIWNGLSLGVVLWVVLGVVLLPILGRGVFGTALSPKIAAATFGLHLLYGGVLGWSVSSRIEDGESCGVAAVSGD